MDRERAMQLVDCFLDSAGTPLELTLVMERILDDVFDTDVHRLERALHHPDHQIGVLVHGKGPHQANRVVDPESSLGSRGELLGGRRWLTRSLSE
jgi:hypothetical protein